jgi:hypothetical protein
VAQAETFVSNRPHLFICFSSSDEAVALDVVRFLEAEGLKCWISLRDVPPGANYQESIIEALESAKGLIFLFSTNSDQSHEIKKELSVAASLKIPVVPLRLAPVMPTGALRYELATRQWLDIFPDRERGFRQLVERTRGLFNSSEAAGAARSSASSTAAGFDEGETSLPPARSEPRHQVRPPVVAVGSQEFEAIRALLAHHIGPIAKVIMQKASTEARTADDFCERLAAHVKSETDRAAFLRQARARIVSKS